LSGLVVDASVTASWLLRDESRPFPDRALERVLAEGASAPALWWCEIRNALLTAERRGHLTAAQMEQAFAYLAQLDVTLDTTPQALAVIALARRHRLSVYDASYLELAMRRRAELSTLDKALAAAARAEGVSLI
jgi:predicted nucleic acid-binding protein